jgi:hypothetical protein
MDLGGFLVQLRRLGIVLPGTTAIVVPWQPCSCLGIPRVRALMKLVKRLSVNRTHSVAVLIYRSQGWT